MTSRRAYFYGSFAGRTKREAQRIARERGYSVASSPDSGVDCIVLGEGESLATARARLSEEFDAATRGRFERGELIVESESEFFGPESSASCAGATPAAVAELVGVSVGTVRRWARRGLLRPTREAGGLPLFPAREISAARRLAFLAATNHSDDAVAKSVVAFENLERARRNLTEIADAPAERGPSAEPDCPLFFALDLPSQEQRAEAPSIIPDEAAQDLSDADFDPCAIILRLTTTTDGRDILLMPEPPFVWPSDVRGQLRFDFIATPADGSICKPEGIEPLSEEEQQIALAERLREWNESETDAGGRPAFLSLFQGDANKDEPSRNETATEPAATLRFPEASSWRGLVDASRVLLDDSRIATSSEGDGIQERERAARKVADMCEEAWNLEREGYWEEAARIYRAAALAGGADPGVCFRLGKALFLLGDYSAARERFSMVLELDEDFSEARAELGRAYAALGEYDDAFAAFTGAAADRPGDPALKVELGKLYLHFGDVESARREFSAASKLISDPGLASDVARLALALAAPNQTAFRSEN